MTNRLWILLSASGLALAACGGGHDDANNAAVADNSDIAIDNGASANTAAPAAPLTSQAFANAASASDQFEIESSKLAAAAADSADVKAFATKMIAAHSASTAKLKTLAAGLNLTPDPTLSAEQEQKLENLKTLQGADFDSAYAAAQVAGHQATLAALKAYAASGDNASLKQFASQMIPTVTAHLNMANGLP
jgi:putative membrane protein